MVGRLFRASVCWLAILALLYFLPYTLDVLSISPPFSCFTPSLFLFLAHLFLGNIVLGVLEAFALNRFTLGRKGWPGWRPIATMTLANIASFFVGCCASDLSVRWFVLRDGEGIYQLDSSLALVALITWFAMFLIQAPFLWLAFPSRERSSRGRRLLLVGIAKQAALCALVVLLYADAAITPDCGLLDPTLTERLEDEGNVFYIDQVGSVWQTNMRGEERLLVAKANSYERSHGLLLLRYAAATQSWDLVRRYGASTFETLRASMATAESYWTDNLADLQDGTTLSDYVLSRSPEEQGLVAVPERDGDGDIFGVRVYPLGRGSSTSFTMDSALVSARADDRLIVTSNGMVIFGFFGNIMVMAPYERKVCAVARGWTPVFVPYAAK